MPRELAPPRFSLGDGDGTLPMDDSATGTGGVLSGRPSLPTERGTTSAAPQLEWSPAGTGDAHDIMDAHAELCDFGDAKLMAKAAAMAGAGAAGGDGTRGGYKREASKEVDDDVRHKKRARSSAVSGSVGGTAVFDM